MGLLSKRSPSRNVAGAGLVVLAIGAVNCACGTEQRRIQTVPDALACAREALGGTRALSAVSSLVVTWETTPDPANKRGLPSTTEITLGFPDKFKTTSRTLLPNGKDLVSVQGFSGDRQLSKRVYDQTLVVDEPDEASLLRNQHGFARWALMLLLRETAPRPLTWSQDLTSADQHFSVAASGPDGFIIALLLDKATCQPVAAVWDRAPNFGDGMSGRTSASGRYVERRDLLEYQTFDGIRLPTRIRTATDGIPRSELKLTSARVNPSLPDDLLDSPRTAGGFHGER